MTGKFAKYEADLKRLVDAGDALADALQHRCYPEEMEKQWRAAYETAREKYSKEDVEKIISKLKRNSRDFVNLYNGWYSESLALITVLLPGRLDDFVALYRKPKGRKDINFENYVIEDALVGLTTSFAGQVKVNESGAIPRMQQQVAILKSIETRFRSTLFDLETFVQADIFDSEIDAARELAKHKFLRAAGAICGVIIEKHLEKVAKTHKIQVAKKNPTIADFNDALKTGSVIDTVKWRQIQQLGDVRNMCAHNKSREPTPDEVTELIDGTDKLIKTLF